MPTQTTKDLPGGLTAKEAADLLRDLERNPAAESDAKRKLSPREKAIASLMRPRDHLDGCPSGDEPPTALARVEAYETETPAPGPALRKLGAVPGDVAITIRCMTCAATTYRLSTIPRGTVPAGEGRHVSALLVSILAGDAGELDTTLGDNAP